MLTSMVRNLSKMYYTFSYTYRRHKTKLKLVLLESLGTVIGDSGYETVVAERCL